MNTSGIIHQGECGNRRCQPVSGDRTGAFQGPDAALPELLGKVSWLHGEGTYLNGEVSCLQGGDTYPSGEVSCLHGGDTYLNGEVSCLHGGDTYLHGEVSCPHGEDTYLNGEVTCLHGEDTYLHGEVTCLHGEDTYLHGEVTCLQREGTYPRGEVTCLHREATCLRPGHTDLSLKRAHPRQDASLQDLRAWAGLHRMHRDLRTAAPPEALDPRGTTHGARAHAKNPAPGVRSTVFG